MIRRDTDVRLAQLGLLGQVGKLIKGIPSFAQPSLGVQSPRVLEEDQIHLRSVREVVVIVGIFQNLLHLARTGTEPATCCNHQ